jgi:hypothetical protein
MTTLHMRLAFTAYWIDTDPSTEIFYFPNQPLNFSVETIAVLQNELLTLMQTWHSNRVHNLIYIAYGGVEMTASDVSEAGWHVITQASAITPIV